MQKLAGRVSPLSRPIAAANPVAVVQDQVSAPSLADVWRSTITAFITHAAPLLLVGVIGFALVPLLSSALLVVSVPLARMAMTQIVTHGAPTFIVRPHKLLSSLRCLMVNGVYMAIVIAGQIGMGVPLRAWGLNLNFAEQKVSTWESAAQTLAMRGINALSNIAELPFASELRVWRNSAFDEWTQQPNANYEQKQMADYWQRGPDAAGEGGMASIEAKAYAYRLSRPDLRVIWVAGVLTIFMAETLFAFRSVPDAKPTHLLRFTLTHFGTIAGHLWLLRLVAVGLKVIFVFVPLVVVDYYAYLAHDWGWFGSPIQGYALAMCLAVINAIVTTFEAVYTAQLYLARVGSKH